MIARHDACDTDRLAMLLADSLDIEDQLQLTEHLDRCELCRDELERLAGERSWWEDTQEVLAGFTELETRMGTSSIGPNSVWHSPSVSRDSSLCVSESDLDESKAPSPDHWVMGLLVSTNDPHALGEIDSLPVLSVVGQGGMGVVLKARDESLHRFLAIKLLSPMLASTGAARARFLREAQAAAAVVHPNIVPIYAVVVERKLPYLVMPFVAGGNLQQHLDEHGPQSVERVLSVGLQVAEGLAAAHRQGIVHRDVKPANLMLDEGGFRVMLTDFGLARVLDDATLTGSGMVAGTPQFMSPEQALGRNVDHRSDIYSLGAVLYALATGRPPYRGNSTLDILRKIGEDDPKPIVEINETYPSWFQGLIDRLMTRDIDRRVQTADEVAALLRACLAHARAPHQVSLPVGIRPKRRRKQVVVGATMLLIASISGALAWTQWNDNKRNVVINPQPPYTLSPSTSPPYTDSQIAASHPSTPQLAVPRANSILAWEATDVDAILAASEQQLQQLRSELGSIGFQPVIRRDSARHTGSAGGR